MSRTALSAPVRLDAIAVVHCDVCNTLRIRSRGPGTPVATRARRTKDTHIAALLLACDRNIRDDLHLSEEMKRFVQQTAQDWRVPAVSVAIVSSRGSTGTIQRMSNEPSKSASCPFVGGFCFSNGTTNIPNQASGGEADSQSIDKDTLFPLASLTKLFTAVAVGVLVEEGKVAWSTKIKDILPEFRMVDEATAERLTVEMILSHQSELYG